MRLIIILIILFLFSSKNTSSEDLKIVNNFKLYDLNFSKFSFENSDGYFIYLVNNNQQTKNEILIKLRDNNEKNNIYKNWNGILKKTKKNGDYLLFSKLDQFSLQTNFNKNDIIQTAHFGETLPFDKNLKIAWIKNKIEYDYKNSKVEKYKNYFISEDTLQKQGVSSTINYKTDIADIINYENGIINGPAIKQKKNTITKVYDYENGRIVFVDTPKVFLKKKYKKLIKVAEKQLKQASLLYENLPLHKKDTEIFKKNLKLISSIYNKEVKKIKEIERKKRIAEEKRIAEKKRIAEEKRIVEDRKRLEAQRIAERKEFEKKREARLKIRKEKINSIKEIQTLLLKKYTKGEIALIKYQDMKTPKYGEKKKEAYSPHNGQDLMAFEKCSDMYQDRVLYYNYIDINLFGKKTNYEGYLIPKDIKDYDNLAGFFTIKQQNPPRSHAALSFQSQSEVFNFELKGNDLIFLRKSDEEGTIKINISAINFKADNKNNDDVKPLFNFKKLNFISGNKEQEKIFEQKQNITKFFKSKGFIYGTCPKEELVEKIDNLNNIPLDQTKYLEAKNKSDRYIKEFNEKAFKPALNALKHLKNLKENKISKSISDRASENYYKALRCYSSLSSFNRNTLAEGLRDSRKYLNQGLRIGKYVSKGNSYHNSLYNASIKQSNWVISWAKEFGSKTCY